MTTPEETPTPTPEATPTPTPAAEASQSVDVEKQLRDLATQIAEMTKLGFDPATIRKGIISAVNDAATPPTVSLNISGDTETLVTEVRTLNNYTPLVGQTVLLAKQGTEIFLLGAIASVNPTTTSVTDNGWIQATLAGGTHDGNGNGNVFYRKILDHGSWKMQWQGGWAPAGATTMVSGLGAEYLPSSLRSVLCARDATGSNVVKMDFTTAGAATLIGTTTVPAMATDGSGTSGTTATTTATDGSGTSGSTAPTTDTEAAGVTGAGGTGATGADGGDTTGSTTPGSTGSASATTGLTTLVGYTGPNSAGSPSGSGGLATHGHNLADISDHSHAGGSHSHSSAAHTHTQPTHTHTGPSHTHSTSSHSHTVTAHTHTTSAHSHTVASHTHTTPAHTHVLTVTAPTWVSLNGVEYFL